jgi:hypothetical protein
MTQTDERSRTAVEELAVRLRSEMIPVTGKFSYFCLLPIAEEDLRQYLNEPIAAISPGLAAALPPIGLLLAPYLEKGSGKEKDCVVFEHPPESRQILSSHCDVEGMTVIALGAKEIEIADYHYRFYSALSEVVASHWPQEAQDAFYRTLREELSANIHGEVDEKSWRLKQALLRRQTNVRKETKLFRDYARQSFIDTLTLYLHGACCDIDVETGPRQMPSRYLRRRLELLISLFPPPEGYAVLPEQLKSR